MTNDHTAKQFDLEMEGIRSGVLSMGGMVEKQLSRAIDALEEEDDAQLLDAVGADEAAINQLQISIDQQCAQIIARRQPTAVDLRMVLTVSKIVNDLERIGDEVKKVAYKAAQARDDLRALLVDGDLELVDRGLVGADQRDELRVLVLLQRLDRARQLLLDHPAHRQDPGADRLHLRIELRVGVIVRHA